MVSFQRERNGALLGEPGVVCSRKLLTHPTLLEMDMYRFETAYDLLIARFRSIPLLVPTSQTWPPSIHVPAILLVLSSEFGAQSWLFVKEYEQVYAEGNRDRGSNRGWVGVPENYPQSDPPCCEAHVHGVPHAAVETHLYQSLRRNDRSRRAASRPTEVPDTAQGNGES